MRPHRLLGVVVPLPLRRGASCCGRRCGAAIGDRSPPAGGPAPPRPAPHTAEAIGISHVLFLRKPSASPAGPCARSTGPGPPSRPASQLLGLPGPAHGCPAAQGPRTARRFGRPPSLCHARCPQAGRGEPAPTAATAPPASPSFPSSPSSSSSSASSPSLSESS